MMLQVDNSCSRCIRYLEARTCLAFPQRIPDEIWVGDVKHIQPIEGDHGMQFILESEVVPTKDADAKG